MNYKKGLAMAAVLTAVGTSALFLNQKDADAATVATTNDNVARLYTEDGKLITNRALAPHTPWLVGKILSINSETMYQVATNEYLRAKDSRIDFGNGSSNNTPVSSDLELTSANISRYFVKYLNKLREVNGLSSVQSTDDLNNYAMERANQQSYTKLDHSTASRKMAENLEISGFHDFKIYKMNAKQAAYFIISAWYNENNNFVKAGQRGHFGHRAALLYTGSNVGLAVNETNVAFEADWDESLDNQFRSVYNYVGDGQPNTKFISADSI